MKARKNFRNVNKATFWNEKKNTLDNKIILTI